MENNQAFGWLMKSASALLTPANGGGHNSIEGCNDISTLIDGVARDFEAATSVASSASSNDSTTAENNNDLDVAAAASGTEETTTTTNNNNNIHLENLTARLDRIKTLLYEERSTSSAAVTQNGGVINLNWTPSVATEVFKCFTGLKNSRSNSDGSRKRNDSYDDAAAAVNNDGSNNINNGSNNEAGTTTTKATTIDLLPKLLQNLHSLPFEARKSISAIFNYLLVCGLDGGVEAVQFASVSTAFGSYVLERAQLIIGTLVYCHGTQQQQQQQQQGVGVVSGGGGAVKDGGQQCVDITLLCGSMLRSSLRHASIYQWVLNDEHCEQFVYPFLDEYVHDPNFDVSSDALETVRVMFTGLVAPNGGGGGGGGGFDGYNDDADTAYEEYKQQMESIAAEFLDRKYDPIINDRMNKKCISSNAAYMTRRMSLQLLSTILLNRSNFNVMMRYISSSQNLVTILCLLRDPSPHITLDAFQVFKIFVANPGKPVDVVKILFDNKVKLIKYLTNLHKEREGSDEQYRDEKGLVIATLEGLEMPDSAAAVDESR